MLNTLLSQYGKDNRITHIVDSLDIYVLPVFNVDGYEYTCVPAVVCCRVKYWSVLFRATSG